MSSPGARRLIVWMRRSPLRTAARQGKAMPDSTSPTAPPCRPVTPDEVDHYQEFGWVKLEDFVHPAMVRTLLDVAQRRMGEDGDSNAPFDLQQPFFNPEFGGALADPSLRPLMGRVGAGARALMRRRPGLEVRYFCDLFAPKLPAAKPARHAGNGRSYFHQDYGNWGVDRSGGLTFWIALADLTPASGTMSFVDRSHRFGVMGHYRSYGEDRDLLDAYPELRDQCSITGPLSYAAGDVTVHSNLTVHGAGPNLTEAPRWAYLICANPADVLWNGAPPEAYDTTGMQMLQAFDDERFPIIG
jgi:hypothetical protein